MLLAALLARQKADEARRSLTLIPSLSGSIAQSIKTFYTSELPPPRKLWWWARCVAQDFSLPTEMMLGALFLLKMRGRELAPLP